MRELWLFLGIILAAIGAAKLAPAQDTGRYPLIVPEIYRLPPPPPDSSSGSEDSDAPLAPLPPEEESAAETIPAPAPSAEIETAAKVDEVIDPAPLPWWKPWEGSFELGMNGTTGNMETFNLRIGAKAKRPGPLWVHTDEFTHIYKTNNGKTIAYSLLFDSRAERLFPETPWMIYLHELTEYDEFKAFEVRLSADMGVGYHWIKTEISKLLTRFGPSVSREIGGANDQLTPELDFGLEFEHTFTPKNKVGLKSDYFPSVYDFGDFRVNTRASWEVVVAPVWGVSLKFSLIDRYDSTPGINRQRNDLDYSLLALWNY